MKVQGSGFRGSRVEESAPPLAAEASSQIEKETNEHRTSNIERPTSNNVFCQLKKRLSKTNLPFGILRIGILWFACFKLDKA